MKKIIAIVAAGLGAVAVQAQPAGATIENGPVYNWHDYYRSQNPVPDGQPGYGYPNGWGRPYVLSDGRVVIPGRDPRYDRARTQRDRDGDGVPNRRDRYPDNPRRR